MRLMRTWVAVEYNEFDKNDTLVGVISEIAPEPPYGVLLFTEWEKDGSGAWLTWRIGDYRSDDDPEVSPP